MAALTRFGFSLLFLCCLQASDFHVAPSGSAAGNGTLTIPWDLATALAQPSSVKPGDTIYLHGGLYQRPATIVFRSYLTGSSGQYITVRAYQGQRVTIDGGIEILRPWVIFRDIEVMSSSTLRQSSEPGSWPSDIESPVGFGIHAANVKLINNIIHDTAEGIDSWVSAPDNEIYGNLVYYNGWKGPDRAHGHGIYAQNQTGTKWITDNIVHNQFETGLHFYGSSLTYLAGFRLEGNMIFNNSSLAMNGWYSRNILLGGSAVATDPVLEDNYTYYPPQNGTGDVNIGYWPGGAGCSQLQMRNNYFVSGGRSLALQNCSVASMIGNTIYGPTHGFDPAQYPQNTYLGTTRPSAAKVIVRPNRYESGRANIAVYNWNLQSTVQVDLNGTGLQPGDQYELRSAQNYYFDVTTGTYTGQPISVPMTGRTVAQPVGWSAPASTFPEFGVFVVRKLSGGTSADSTPPTVTIVTPQQGETIRDSIDVQAVADDDTGVAGVQFRIDNVNLGPEDIEAPYMVVLDTTTLSDSGHTISAVARDVAGNMATSSTVTVTVDNTVVVPVLPAITQPSPGATLPGSTVAFQWTAHQTAVSTWWLYLGSSLGGSDIQDSGSLASNLSFTSNRLPVDGRAVFVRLWFLTGGVWKFTDFTYTAATLTASQPALISPTPGSTLAGSSVSFSWSANNTPVSEWWLELGSNLGGRDLFDSGSLGTALSRTVNGLPTDGRAIFARLWYRVSGAWNSRNFQYQAATVAGSGWPVIASPPPGSVLAGSTVTFSWISNGTNVKQWWLYIGSSVGGRNIYDSGSIGVTSLSRTVSSLPTNGQPLYVRLWFLVGSVWQFADFPYTAP